MFIVVVVKTRELSHKYDLAFLVEERAFMPALQHKIEGLLGLVKTKAAFMGWLPVLQYSYPVNNRWQKALIQVTITAVFGENPANGIASAIVSMFKVV